MNISSNILCCGCRACEQVCPTHAVSIDYNNEGFLKALIDEEKCIDCKKCVSVCPMIEPKWVYENRQIAFAAVNRDEAVVRKSSSGGMFTAFAEYILSRNGCVYGCHINDSMYPEFIRVTKLEEIDQLRRSKYVQCDTRNTYTKVKQDLFDGLLVLYVGTPCQIGGLRKFLGKNYNNLFCVDLICHGVPSAELFRKNIEYLSEKNKSPVKKYEFRLKSDALKNAFYYYYYYCENGKEAYKPYFYDAYYEAFYNFKSYNEVCYKCPYACAERVGDITIGDYHWAVNHHEDLREKNGNKKFSVSCIIVNSDKGKTLLRQVEEKLDLYETRLEWIVERNKNLIRPTARPKERDNFYQNISKNGYRKWARKYYFSKSFLKHIPPFSILIKVKHRISSICKRN